MGVSTAVAFAPDCSNTDCPRGSPNEGGGLRNMRERAERLDGDFTVLSPPEGGTRVTWNVPLA